MRKLPPDQLEDELFLAMVETSRAGAGPDFDLIALCQELGIEAKPQDLISFTSDHDGLYGDRDVTNSYIRFKLNAEGRRHALNLARARQPRTLRDRIASITRSDWIALGAFLVSVIALFKK